MCTSREAIFKKDNINIINSKLGTRHWNGPLQLKDPKV